MSWHFSAAVEAAYSAGNSLGGPQSAPWSGLPFAADDSCSGKMKATCHRSPFGTMFVPSTDAHGVALLTSLLADFRARASVLPVMAPDWITKSRHFGVTKPASLASLKPPQSGLRTHQRSLFGGGFESLETLPRWGMIVDGELYPLPTPSGLTELRALITSESGFGLPERTATPQKSDGKRGQQRAEKHGGNPISRVPTPTCGGGGQTIPTGTSPTGKRPDGTKATVSLEQYLNHFAPTRVPTMTCADAHGRTYQYDNGDKTKPRHTLSGLVAQTDLGGIVPRVPAPTTQDASNNGPASQQERNTKPLNAEVGGPLNPDWVEWLMGWPIGWTDLRPLETDKYRQWLNSHGSF
jgi:hypothetical protein